MDIYREEILDHFKHPRNFGKIKNSSVSHKETNASCGDVLEISLKVEKERVAEVGFEGEGCAVSMASTSMLTELVKNKSLGEIKKMGEEDIEKMLGIEISSGRKKCANLGLVSLKKAIDVYEEK